TILRQAFDKDRFVSAVPNDDGSITYNYTDVNEEPASITFKKAPPTTSNIEYNPNSSYTSNVSSPAGRNNNPLNLRPRGASTGFQQFNTLAEGFKAAVDDINVKLSG